MSAASKRVRLSNALGSNSTASHDALAATTTEVPARGQGALIAGAAHLGARHGCFAASAAASAFAPRWWLMRLLAAMTFGIVSLGATRANADALTPLLATPLPDTREAIAVATLEKSVIALHGDGTASVLDADATRWRALAWAEDPARIAGAFGNGQRAYLLRRAIGSDLVASVERIVVDGERLVPEALPALPVPIRQVQATVRDDVLHLAGVAEDGVAGLWRYDGAAKTPRWEHRDWPASDAAQALVAQANGLVAIIGEQAWRWTTDTGWLPRGATSGRIVPGSGQALGQAHVAFLAQRGAQLTPVTWQTITNGWADLPGTRIAPGALPLPWPEGLAWASVDAGRTSVSAAQVQARKLLLTWLDWVVIVVYLAAMIGIGLYFYLREKRNSTANFFVGNRTIPFWAAGLSLYAVNTSSISFIAIPAKAFETNWQYLTNNLIAVIGLMFVAVWVVPLLRRLDLMSTFSYLETRFHPSIRMMASALAIVMQIGSRMSVILFLPALAIATITGISVVWSIILMGGFTIVYTAMGGMKAVIWTDVVQVIVKMGGAVFAIGFIVWSLDKGVGGFLADAMSESKMKLFDFSFDLTKATVWGFVFLVLFEVVLTFPKDQVLMQRVLSTKSDKEAGRSIWAFAAIMIPGGFVFYMIGTALFFYYRANPERMNPLLPIDATFPLFIAAELPMGVTGLIIAGIFAAAMATLSGIMNSVATLITVDFYDRFAKDKSQKKGVFFAEMMTVLVGLVGIGAALVLSRFDVHSLFDVSIELAGLLGGGFAGAYTLGMFTKRANSQGVAIGIASAIVLTFIAWTYKLVHPYFYLAISILVCVVVGYLASYLFPAPRRDLKGLTVFDK